MIFSSYTFLLAFLPITIAGFALCTRRGAGRGALGWLVACSLVFYGWWNPAYLGLLGASILFNYACGLYLSCGAPERRRRCFLIAAVTANLLALAYFKYANFVLDTANALLGSDCHLASIALPLAISFFTFTQIAYLIDAYRAVAVEHDLLDYTFFVAFFPHLIAGPIVHHREILPQVRGRPLRLTGRNLAVGLAAFQIGLAKKVLLADQLAPYVSRVFEGAAAGTAPDFATAWIASVSFLLQLYFDFSGYSDMAIGLSKIFGVRLPLNFASPLKAASMIEFWACWHMTLTRFFREYLWEPLGGARPSPGRRAAAILVTFLVIGLWHGAAWTFVVFGAANGLFVIANHAWRWARRKYGWGGSNPGTRLAARAITFATVTVSALLFRATTFEATGRMLAALLGLTGIDLSTLGMRPERWLLLLGSLLIAWTMPNTQQILRRYEPALGAVPPWRGRPRLEWRPSPIWAGALSLLTIAALLGMSRADPFVYFQF